MARTKKTPRKSPDKTASEALRALLRKRYDPAAWALFEEVRNAAAHKSVRTADAVAMSLWPSRGLHIHGFEIKSSRKDWLNELKSPEKAEPIMRYCDFWWLVAPRDVAVDSEIPKTWGWMVPHGNTLKIVKDAPKLEPQPLDCSFVAVLLKNAQERARLPERLMRCKIEEELQAQFDREIEDRVKRAYNHEVYTLKHRVSSLEEELKDLREIEQKVGRKINRWDLTRYADGLDALSNITEGRRISLKYVLHHLRSSLDAVEKASAMLEDMREPEAEAEHPSERSEVS
jgi:hypothetical protein